MILLFFDESVIKQTSLRKHPPQKAVSLTDSQFNKEKIVTKISRPLQSIEEKIFFIRGQKVMLDSHPAELYEVKTKVLLQAVKRNVDRFPVDFMFQLSAKESGRREPL